MKHHEWRLSKIVFDDEFQKYEAIYHCHVCDAIIAKFQSSKEYEAPNKKEMFENWIKLDCDLQTVEQIIEE